jgi:hypothetical protein
MSKRLWLTAGVVALVALAGVLLVRTAAPPEAPQLAVARSLLTPRPTATPNTPTPTRTATATPNWVTLNCPAITPAVNGTIAEWGAVTPVALNSGSAALIQPPTPVGTVTPTGTPPPVSADASATLYCGRAGDVLYFAGTVLDDTFTSGTTYRTRGSVAWGDAVRITLDGRRDGLSGGDDHDLFISPGGRLRDFDTHPISNTLAIGSVTGGWTFELALDASELEISPLASGSKFGIVWHVQDADTSAGLDYVLDDRKRMATIP